MSHLFLTHHDFVGAMAPYVVQRVSMGLDGIGHQPWWPSCIALASHPDDPGSNPPWIIFCLVAKVSAEIFPMSFGVGVGIGIGIGIGFGIGLGAQVSAEILPMGFGIGIGVGVGVGICIGIGIGLGA